MNNFKVTCLKCGSENIIVTTAQIGNHDPAAIISCQDCGNEESEE